MLRGVGYGAEWVSNLHLGENSWHYGFVTAAEQFFADLQDYLACAKAAAGELGTIKLWLGGYSRGAAVANLAAAPGAQGAAADRAGEHLCVHLCSPGGTDSGRPAGAAGRL